MTIPGILSASAIDERRLKVEFDNREQRIYDVSKWLDSEAFAPLNNPAFFKNVRVESGGFAVSWNDDVNLAEYEIWTNGTPVG
jgi:hypothetical protein